MTSAPIFVAPPGLQWHRLLTVGTVAHVTACRARISATEPVLISAVAPQPDDMCTACRLDIATRPAGADLGPYAGELGVVAELDAEDDQDAVAAWDQWWAESNAEGP